MKNNDMEIENENFQSFKCKHTITQTKITKQNKGKTETRANKLLVKSFFFFSIMEHCR